MRTTIVMDAQAGGGMRGEQMSQESGSRATVSAQDACREYVAISETAHALLRHDPEQAEDVSQDLILGFLRTGRSGETHAGAYRATAVRRRAARDWEKAARRREVEENASRATTMPGAGDDWHEQDTRTAILACVEDLAEPYRSTVQARFWDGEMPRVIAEREGVGVATVKSRLHRGLSQLKESLERRVGGAEALRRALIPVAGGSGSKLAAITMVALALFLGGGLTVLLVNDGPSALSDGPDAQPHAARGHELHGAGNGGSTGSGGGLESKEEGDALAGEGTDAALVTAPFEGAVEDAVAMRTIEIQVLDARGNAIAPDGARLRVNLHEPGPRHWIPREGRKMPVGPESREAARQFHRMADIDEHGVATIEVPDLDWHASLAVSRTASLGMAPDLGRVAVMIDAGEPSRPIIRLPRLRRFAGTVVDVNTGLPVAGVRVALHEEGSRWGLEGTRLRPIDREVLTDEKGRWEFRDSMAAAAIHLPRDQDWASKAELVGTQVSDEPLVDLVIPARRTIVVRGRVFVREGVGLPFATVSNAAFLGANDRDKVDQVPGVRFQQTVGRVSADEKGFFSIRILDDGEPFLVVSQPDINIEIPDELKPLIPEVFPPIVGHHAKDPTAFQQIMIPAVDPEEEAQPEDPVRVRGEVVDAEGRPVPGASVYLGLQQDGVLADEAGRFTFRAPADRDIEGPAVAGIEGHGFIYHDDWRQLGEGTESEPFLRLQLRPLREVVLEIQDREGKPLQVPHHEVGRYWNIMVDGPKRYRYAGFSPRMSEHWWALRQVKSDEKGIARVPWAVGEPLRVGLLARGMTIGSAEDDGAGDRIVLRVGIHAASDGHVAVTVLDQRDGRPVRGASATVWRRPGKPGSGSGMYGWGGTVSGDDGKLRIPGVHAGPYRITVEAPGYVRHASDWMELGGGEVKLTVRLLTPVRLDLSFHDSEGRPHVGRTCRIYQRQGGEDWNLVKWADVGPKGKISFEDVRREPTRIEFDHLHQIRDTHEINLDPMSSDDVVSHAFITDRMAYGRSRSQEVRLEVPLAPRTGERTVVSFVDERGDRWGTTEFGWYGERGLRRAFIKGPPKDASLTQFFVSVPDVALQMVVEGDQFVPVRVTSAPATRKRYGIPVGDPVKVKLAPR